MLYMDSHMETILFLALVLLPICLTLELVLAVYVSCSIEQKTHGIILSFAFLLLSIGTFLLVRDFDDLFLCPIYPRLRFMLLSALSLLIVFTEARKLRRSTLHLSARRSLSCQRLLTSTVSIIGARNGNILDIYSEIFAS